MELVALAGVGDLADELGGLDQHPAVDRAELIHGDGVRGGVEVEEVAELVAQRVAHAAILVRDGLEDRVGERDVALVVLGGDPEAHDVGAVFLDVVVGGLRLAVGLRDLLALLVHDEAVREHRAIWSGALDGDGGPERGLEPAAMLVGAFEVEVGRPVQVLVLGAHGEMARTGVDPDVERVGALAHVLGPGGRDGRAGEDFLDGGGPPPIAPARGDLLGDVADDAGVEVRFAGGRGIERRNRHAPGALTRDAPIRTAFEGGADAVLAGGGDPLHVADGGERLLAEVAAVEADEPLVERAEDDRGLGAPAVRIGMFEALRLEEGALGLQQFEHGDVRRVLAVGLEDGDADQRGGHLAVVGIRAVVADRAIRLEAILVAGLIVFDAVAGGGVHAARASVGGDVVGEHDRRGAVDERMPRLQAFERPALDLEAIDGAFERARGDERFAQGGGDEERAFAMADLDVFELRMHGDREVRGERPRRGRPDDDGERVRGRELLGGGIDDREGDPDGVRALVLVLDLGFGERGLARDGPIHRLLGAVDEALFDEAGEAAQDLAFVGRIHRAVFRSPVGEDAQALELAALLLDVGGGEFGAGLAHAEGVERLLLGLEFLHHLVLDRETMAVPARDVRRAETAHGLVAQDGVLEQLVERGADVHVSVGEGRSVVEDEGRLAGGPGLDLAIETVALPVGDPDGFAFGQAGPHREVGDGQVEGILELFGHV